MIKIWLLLLPFLLYANAYKVVSIIDGDTIVVKQNKKDVKVRLFGIDAPESTQSFGAKCTKLLSSKIYKKYVNLDFKGTDKYDRKIAIVKLNNEDINKFMVASGCAWAYTYFSNKYKDEELKARRHKKGLWIEKHPMNPYEYRKLEKNKRSELEEIKKLFLWVVAWER